MQNMWVTIFVCAIVLVLLFLLANIIKNSKPRKKSEAKESNQKEKNTPPPPQSPQKEITSSQDPNLADELKQLINNDNVNANEKDSVKNNKTARISRVNNYYEKRWHHRQKDKEEFDVEFDEDNDNIQLTQEDVKKLLALKDIFDKNHQN